MTEDRDDIIVLVDEEGEETEFEHLDTIEMNGNEYVVLLPYSEEDDESEEDEVIILKIEHGSDGEDAFANIEDEDEMEAVFEEFKTRMEDEYDEDDE